MNLRDISPTAPSLNWEPLSVAAAGFIAIPLVGWLGVLPGVIYGAYFFNLKRTWDSNIKMLQGHYAPLVATVFGVSEKGMYEVGIWPATDGIWINPAPPSLMVKLSDPAKIEAQLAVSAPELTLCVDDSGSRRIKLKWADEQTQAAREMREQSGGLIEGVEYLGDAPRHDLGDSIPFDDLK